MHRDRQTQTQIQTQTQTLKSENKHHRRKRGDRRSTPITGLKQAEDGARMCASHVIFVRGCGAASMSRSIPMPHSLRKGLTALLAVIRDGVADSYKALFRLHGAPLRPCQFARSPVISLVTHSRTMKIPWRCNQFRRQRPRMRNEKNVRGNVGGKQPPRSECNAIRTNSGGLRSLPSRLLVDVPIAPPQQRPFSSPNPGSKSKKWCPGQFFPLLELCTTPYTSQ